MIIPVKVCMKKLRIAALLLLTGLVCSCGQMNKILKSEDPERIYQQGLKDYYARKYKNVVVYMDHSWNTYYNTDRADTILFYSAKSMYNMGDYASAAQFFDQYRRDFSRRNFTEEAEYLLPMSYYRSSRAAERDQTETNKAIVAFNEYLNRYPESIKADDIKAMLDELQLKLYLKDYINSSLYVKLGRYPAAIAAMRSSLKQYPETPYREEMLYLISKSWYNYARKSIPQRKLDRYMKMVDSYYNFKSEYPQSEQYNRELERMFAESRIYVERNQQAILDLEKSLIEIEMQKSTYRQRKAELKTIKDPIERDAARNQLKRDRSALKAREQETKKEARILRKKSSEKALSRDTAEAAVLREE